jgi:hypothetical protein
MSKIFFNLIQFMPYNIEISLKILRYQVFIALFIEINF